MSSQSHTPTRSPRRLRRRPSSLPFLLSAASVAAVVIILAVFLGQNPEGRGAASSVSPSQTLPPVSTQELPPTGAPVPTLSAPQPTDAVPSDPAVVLPTLTPAPTDSAVPAASYDFSQPAPEAAAAEEGWFSDAVFMGDSRTDGLRLYGGISGADFIQHTGITVFEIGTKECIRINGEKYTMMEALGLKQYGKVFIMLGVNELGYFNDQAFADAYAKMVDDIRAIQPGAVIYLQNLVSVNPEKCRANSQPYYVTNEQIAVYNDIIAEIAAEKRAVLVDVNAALVDDSGILPAEGTTDGVHFTKDYYVKWYDYLKVHTVDPALYWAGQEEVGREGA